MQQGEISRINRRQIAAIIVAAVVVTLISMVWLGLSPRNASATPVKISLPTGSGAAAVGSILEHAGIVRSALALRLYAIVTGQARTLKAGQYLLCPCASVSELVSSIANGQGLSTDLSLTIPEGKNIWEIDNLLSVRHLIVPGSFARTYVGNEGMLFPDTYRFDATVADHSGEYGNARVFGAVLRDAFDTKARIYTPSQIIVASILEKEAKTAADMALVAGIIAERQKRGMALQIDASVAYGWCLSRWLPMSSTSNCDVTLAPIKTETKVDGAYNTYTRTGLPKGPISNPGLKALEAAAHPTASPYLYYLSTRDGSQIIYSKTLDEHLKNRVKYLGF